jgi:hypothetical protein
MVWVRDAAMAKTSDHKSGAKPQESREDRLKAALKANIAKRKAQARARSEAEQGPDVSTRDKEG